MKKNLKTNEKLKNSWIEFVDEITKTAVDSQNQKYFEIFLKTDFDIPQLLDVTSFCNIQYIAMNSKQPNVVEKAEYLMNEIKFLQSFNFIQQYNLNKKPKSLKMICLKCSSNEITCESPIAPMRENIFLNGAYIEISPGYGSVHDSDNFIGAICDSCISLLTKTKILNEKIIF